MSLQEEVAKKLLQINAIKLNPQNPFTWASGFLSPIYCDNRLILSFPSVRDWFAEKMTLAAQDMRPFDLIAGVATGGLPMGALIADRLIEPYIYVRSKAKDHGRQNMVEGHYEKGQKVLVIEDLISTGGSSLQAVEGLRACGLEVVGVLAYFQYGFEISKQKFEEAKCKLVTMSNFPTLLSVALESGYISESDLPLLEAWRLSPSTWSPNESPALK